MLLYLLRHGETDWNAQRRIQGVSDTALNATGLAQARALAGPLRGRSIAAFYSSPLRRARQTAEVLAGELGLGVRLEPRLSELDQGKLEGLRIDQVEAQYNGFMEEWRSRPAGLRMPGGETLAELQERAWAAVEDLRSAHPRETIAAVSHNLAISAVLCRVLGIDLNAFRRIRQFNAALNLVEHSPARGWNVVIMNSLAHLSGVPDSEGSPYL
ncbi:MAG: histidine phosphatase family protein [Nitrospinota bacterium]